ncbi:MAG: 50S ribosomal protein L17 [Candidatus Harrisonbacteria bacterium]|nr:50S ribosomal protein L17 [Candidatus Harrisonbacteria bacterium]
MRKFGRKKGQRAMFIQGLANNLIMSGRIQTTEARAKAIRPVVERLVSTAKKNDLASFRRLLSKLPKQSAEKLYYEIAPKYKEREGGYLRITKVDSRRKRDAAEQSVIEFV